MFNSIRAVCVVCAAPWQRPLQQRRQRQRTSATRADSFTPSRQAVLLAVVLCFCCPLLHRAEAAEFSYGTQSGPGEWGGTCANGDEQSPVNVTSTAAQPDAMHFDYRVLRGAAVLNTGHGAEVQVATGNILQIGQQKWQLLQYHFHTPSEHVVDGRRADMEAHLVHKNLATGELAVVGVLMQAESTHRSRSRSRKSQWCSALEQALALVPSEIGTKSAPHRLQPDTFSSLLVPGRGGGRSGQKQHFPHVHYSGSLTTPPCTEGVSWYVLIQAAPVGAAQVLQFQRLLGGGATLDFNARPAQPLNGRVFD